MKRLLPPLLVLPALAAALALASCAKKADESAGSTVAADPAASPGAATASDLPKDLDQGPRASAEPVDEALVAKGQGLFQTKGCSACHAFGKKVTGPDLAGVTQRRTAKWIQSQILHPDKMTKQDPTAHDLFAKFALQMPNQGLTPDEAKAVLEFFKHTDRASGAAK